MENNKSISYSVEDIKRYRQGLMSKEEMRAFEQASMEDPFLSDALEGYMQSDMALADEHLGNIRDTVNERNEEKEQAVVVNMPKRSFGFMRIAAMLIVIISAGLITYKIVNNKKAGGGEGGDIAKVKTPQVTTPVPATVNPSLKTDTNTAEGSLKKIHPEPSPEVVSNYEAFTADAKTKQQSAGLKKEQQANSNRGDVAVRDAVEENKTGAVRDEGVTPAAPAKNAVTNAKLNGYRTNEIRGTITMPNNEPLANANLKVDNLKKPIVTDNAGNFSFTNKDSVVNATITNGSFANTRVQLKANENNSINLGTIRMAEDKEFEKSVTVVGLGAKKSRMTDSAGNVPVNGWASFQDYVAKTLGTKIDSTSEEENTSTEIEFFVDAKGKPRDVKLINTNDFDNERTKQIMEAVERGPKWANKNKKMRIVIKY